MFSWKQRWEKTCQSYFQEGQEGGSGELQASQAHLNPWEGVRATNLGNNFQNTWRWLGVFSMNSWREKSCLIHLLAFQKEIFGLADEGSGHVGPDFSKVFDSVSQDIFIKKLTKYRPGKWAVSGGQWGGLNAGWTVSLGRLLSAANSPSGDWSPAVCPRGHTGSNRKF